MDTEGTSGTAAGPENVSAEQLPVGSLIGAYAEKLTAKVQAPMDQNAALTGSRLCGPTTLSLEDGNLIVEARRMPVILRVMFLTGTIVLAFGIAGIVLFGVLTLTPMTDVEFNRQNLIGASSVFVAGLVMRLIAEALKGVGAQVTLKVPMSAVSWRTLRTGRRHLLKGPFGVRDKRRVLTVRAANKADHEILLKMSAPAGR